MYKNPIQTHKQWSLEVGRRGTPNQKTLQTAVSDFTSSGNSRTGITYLTRRRVTELPFSSMSATNSTHLRPISPQKLFSQLLALLVLCAVSYGTNLFKSLSNQLDLPQMDYRIKLQKHVKDDQWKQDALLSFMAKAVNTYVNIIS